MDEKKLLQYIAKQDKQIERLYNELINELAKVGISIDNLSAEELFSFADHVGLSSKVNEILRRYSASLEKVIVEGMKQGVNMSYLANSSMLMNYSRLNSTAIKEHRENAKNAFISNRLKPKEGLSLSQNVWNYTQQAKSEFEAAMSEIIEEGLATGVSAEELGRRLRSKLKHPDMVYKRYHLKKQTAKGKRDVIEWRRKVIDSEGKVRYVKEDLEKVGRGVHRSSRKNALRLAATEINMAYRYADNELWNSMPTVIGFKIELSGNHPEEDMCDELVGEYPKTFKWLGWHPRCRCIATAILVSEEERERMYKLSNEEWDNYRSPNLITKMPKCYDKYIEKNRQRILDAEERGKQPYFIRDNYRNGKLEGGYNWVFKGKTKFKTDAQKAAIQAAWDKRRRKNAIEAARVKRHANRDAKAIQAAWDARREKYAKIIKTANNVWDVAMTYPWVNTDNLVWLVSRKQYHLIPTEYKKVAKEIVDARNKKQYLSTLIPNVEEWQYKFSYEELEAAFNSIKQKLDYLSSMPLDKQISKLNFEIHDYLGGNMNGVQDKYPTWKVSQAAYAKQIDKINIKIYKNTIQSDIDEFNKWIAAHPKATGVAKKVAYLSDLLNEDEPKTNLIKTKLGDIKSHIKALDKEAAKTAARKALKSRAQSGTVYSPEEVTKILEYETKIFNHLSTEGLSNSYTLQMITDEYAEYLLKLSAKYYKSQSDVLSPSQITNGERALALYLARIRKNPNHVWGSGLGGEHPNKESERIALAKKLTGVTKQELSLVTRFTNGMTFSNAYLLRHQSSYWKRRWEEKMSMYDEPAVRDEMVQTIAEYEEAINTILNKMHRYDGYVFRGLRDGGADEVLQQLKKAWSGNKIWENIAPASSSTSLRVAQSFDDGSSSNLILIIKNKSGVNIRPISEYSNEREIMLLKNRKYRIVKAPYKLGHINVVELEEII